MAKAIIHINNHVLKANKKNGTDKPAITVKRGKKNTYCHEVEILGPATIVSRPQKPLKCGATTWVETRAKLKLKRRKQ